MLTNQDLLAPLGEIELSLFPGEGSTSVAARLDAYLDEGYAKAVAIVDDDPATQAALRDDAARNWAYHRTYSAIVLIMSRTPATAAIEGEASRSYLAAQIDTFRDLANGKLLAFEALIPGEEEIEITSSKARSGPVPQIITW